MAKKSLNLHTLGENDENLYDFTNKPVLVQKLLKPVWNTGNPYWLTGMQLLHQFYDTLDNVKYLDDFQ